MNDFFELLDNIECLDDIKRLSSNTEDGETDYLEFKSIPNNLGRHKEVAEAISLIAKEICAFLNSNGGIVCWGLEKDRESKKIQINNQSNKNLEELFNQKTKDIIKPTFDTVRTKMISSKEGSFLVIAVNSGECIPYRVESWKDANSKIIKRYFLRSNDSSVEMPESTVRHLYQSKSRIPSISTFSEVSSIDSSSITINAIIKPDERIYIKDFFSKTEITIIENNGEILQRMSPINPEKMISAIYPSDKPYVIERVRIMSDINGLFTAHDGCISIIPKSFHHISALLISTSIACENVSLKTQDSLFLLGTNCSNCKFELCEAGDYSRIVSEEHFRIYRQVANDNIIDLNNLRKALQTLNYF